MSRNECGRRSSNVLEMDLHDGTSRDGLSARFRLAHNFKIPRELKLTRGYVRGRSGLALFRAAVAVIRKVRGVADRIVDAQGLHQPDEVLLTADRVELWPPLAVQR